MSKAHKQHDEPATVVDGYAIAVAMKQCQCDEKQAVQKLQGVDVEALVDAGRNGRIDECRALLGCK
jgi:hypothetical protein